MRQIKGWIIRMTNKKTGAMHLYTWKENKETKAFIRRLREEIKQGIRLNEVEGSEYYGTYKWSNRDIRTVQRSVSDKKSVIIGRMGTEQPLVWLHGPKDDPELEKKRRIILSQWETIEEEYQARKHMWEKERGGEKV